MKPRLDVGGGLGNSCGGCLQAMAYSNSDTHMGWVEGSDQQPSWGVRKKEIKSRENESGRAGARSHSAR